MSIHADQVMTVRKRGFGAGRLTSGYPMLALVPGLILWNGVTAAGVTAAPGALDPAPPAPERAESVDIRFHEGMVSLQLVRAPWTEVLENLGQETGIRFHYAIAPEGEITASCAGMNVPRVLECLLGRGSAHMLRYPPRVERSKKDWLPTEVWILGRPGAGREGSGVVESPRPDPPDATSNRSHARSRDPDQTLMEVVRADDPDARVQALGSLAASGERNDPAVREAFRAALENEDGGVRAQGVYALARNGGPEAIDVLRNALKDDDSSVRLMAVDTAKADAEGTALLRDALTDSDETVRVLAAMKLRQTEHPPESPQ